MKITELFQSSLEIKRLDAKRAKAQFNLDDIVAIYGATLGEAEYIFYVDNCSGEEGDYTFGFGTVRYNGGISHALTNVAGSPSAVFATVFKIIGDFVREFQPLNLSFSGASTRQEKFYDVLLKKMKVQLPDGYKLLRRNTDRTRIYLSRDPSKISNTDMYTVKEEERLDELFATQVQPHEMDEISKAEAFAQFRVTEVVAAWAFYIDNNPYIVYFTPSNYNKKGWYDCNFAKKVDTKRKNEFDLTGDRVPFKVIRYVLEGIQRFLAKYKPISVVGLGYKRRQSDFYKRLVAANRNSLPAPYYWAQDPDGDDEVVIISRSKNLTPVGEKAAEPVAEDAQSDISNLKRAEEIARKFGEWMSKHNENTPFGEIEGVYSRPLRNAERLMYVNGTRFGEDSDLNIGFAWHTDGTHERRGGSLLNGRDGRQTIYFVAMTAEGDPSQKTDLIWSIRWPHLIHELTHYLDRKRQKTPNPKNKMNGLAPGANASKGAEHYYNHALEFNAYFQQGLHQLLPAIKRHQMSDLPWNEFLKDAEGYFDGDFRLAMNDGVRRRFIQRLHALYKQVKAEKPE